MSLERATGAIDDRDAIRRVAAQDGLGLEALYDRYSTVVYSLALRVLRDAADAEDVTQEVFAQIWTQAGRFDPSRGVVAAWVTVLARSRALDRLRRRGPASRTVGGESALPHIPDPSPSVEWIAATAEQADAAREALSALPDEQRTAVELAYYEGLTQAEIATRTSAPLGTVKTRIRTGVQRLRDAVTRRAGPRNEA
ncbi:MAG: sigma-70 family RNA polymerase sigma factor [Vicinamibacterales bacterium]